MKKIILILALGLLLALPLQAKWQEHQTSHVQTEVLNEVESQVVQTKNPVVVFDLDSTLYDNRTRSARIWREYGKKNKIAKLKKTKAEQITSWVIGDYLVGDVGLDKKWVEENSKALKDFWTERFFSNRYLRFDKALPGAADYVRDLHKQGAMIVYITGRDAVNMRDGTVKALKRDGFPINRERTKLILKPESNISFSQKYKNETAYKQALRRADLQFKQDAVREVLKLGTPVASFDNEPANINFYYVKLHKGKQGLAVWLDTDHSPSPETARKGIFTVSGFKR